MPNAKKSSAGSIRAAEYRASKYKGAKSDKVGSVRARGAEAMPKSPQSLRAAMKGISTAKKATAKKAAPQKATPAPAPKVRKGPKSGPGKTKSIKRKPRVAQPSAPIRSRTPFKYQAD